MSWLVESCHNLFVCSIDKVSLHFMALIVCLRTLLIFVRDGLIVFFFLYRFWFALNECYVCIFMNICVWCGDFVCWLCYNVSSMCRWFRLCTFVWNVQFCWLYLCSDGISDYYSSNIVIYILLMLTFVIVDWFLLCVGFEVCVE
jgi:hypothetical protein